LLAHDLNYLTASSFRPLNDAVVELKRMLAALARKVDSERRD
jgi:hypothetical protein